MERYAPVLFTLLALLSINKLSNISETSQAIELERKQPTQLIVQAVTVPQTKPENESHVTKRKWIKSSSLASTQPKRYKVVRNAVQLNRLPKKAISRKLAQVTQNEWVRAKR